MQEILCPRCGNKPEDIWYIFDVYHNQYLWIKCCKGKFPITRIPNLPIETRKTLAEIKREKKAKAKENDIATRLEKDQIPLF